MRDLFSVVYKEHPDTIVDSILAPFDGETLEEARQEAVNTYGEDFMSTLEVVPMTPDLEAQYKELGP